jgi:hypothetical protein
VVTEGIDFAALDATTADLWTTDARELVEFVIGLAQSEDYEPAAGWVARHSGGMRVIPARFVAFAPDAIAASALNGAAVQLICAGVLGWGLDAYVLHLLGERNHALVVTTVEANAERLAKELLIPQSDQCAHLAEFLGVVRELASDSLTAVLERVDPEAARTNWAARLRGTREEQVAAATLIDAALACSGPIGQAAVLLQREFPDLGALVYRGAEATGEDAVSAGEEEQRCGHRS